MADESALPNHKDQRTAADTQPKQQRRTRLAHRMRRVGQVLLTIGMVGWLSGFLTSYAPMSFEMPLGQLEGIVVDSAGRVFLGLAFTSRIQVYDRRGRFLRGWPVDTSGGPFRLRLSSLDELEIATARGDGYFVFDANGTLLHEDTDVPEKFHEFGNTNEFECVDVVGNQYRIPLALLFPYVTRTTPDGSTDVVVRTPIYSWIFMGPLPAWAFLILGGVIVTWSQRTRGKCKSPLEPNLPTVESV